MHVRPLMYVYEQVLYKLGSVALDLDFIKKSLILCFIKISCTYSYLYLYLVFHLHAQFHSFCSCREEGIFALQEAIRLAQQHNNSLLLEYALVCISHNQEWIREKREYPTPVYLPVIALFVIQSTPAHL